MTVGSMERPTGDIACTSQLKRYGQFIEDLQNRLRRTEESMEIVDRSYIVQCQSIPTESASLSELVRSGNDVIDKTLVVLASLCSEVDALKAEAECKFYPALLAYGEDVQGYLTQEGGALRLIGQMLPCLQELSVFINRCYEVCRNVVLQMASLFSNQHLVIIKVKELKVNFVFEALGQLLSVLVVLDEIVKHHPTLKDHWSSYMKAIQVAHHNPNKFSAEVDKLKPLESALARLDSQILSGYILQNCVEQPFDTSSAVQVTTNAVLNDKMLKAIRELFARWDKRCASDVPDKQGLMSIITLIVLHHYIYRTIDKKLIRTIWESYRRIPAFHLVGDIIWTPCEYLTIIMPSVAKVLDKKGVAAVLSYRSFLFEQQSEMLVKEAQAQVLKVGDWCEEMRTTLEAWPKTNIVAQLERRTRLFLRGVRSAELIGRLLKTVLNGHLAEHRTMARTSAQGLFRLIELIKAIEATFARHWSAVVESCNHICQHWTGALLKLVSSGRETLRTDKGYTDERVDMLSALVVVEQALAGPVTKERWYILNLALNLACYTKLFRPNDVTDMENLVGHLWTVSTLGRALERVSDCSFLYWHRSLLPVYFESLIHDSAECQRVVYFFDAINDSTKIIDAVRHAPTSVALEYFQREIFTVFEQSFLTKLCETIETDLRLSIHTHLQLNDRNPFKTNDAVHISPILKVPPLRIRDEFIDIQRYVEHYLEKTFYNLTTVALHDWKTYAEMRQLARQKYGLALAETHLPSQTLEQGLDVLVIMRNIHIFVAGYNYNLNTQCFVQKESRNKHLNTLNTRHITNSIRTHGTGIMNTTVNFTYQFLKKKFYIFSQFLYDDHIKSQLIKDARYFRDNMDQLERMYPIERAEKFNRGIRKLGVTGDGLTFLDQFRIVITQIGNALGFVRLVRAGGLQACSQAIHFIPDLDDIVSLAPLVEQAHLSTETLQAAQIFDTLVSDLVKNFAEGTEYFKLLVDVFAPEFRNFEKYSHLKNFYMIVPPLTVNFVEHILACKERIGKKSQQGEITFTDDGFCMGIAYILKLLDQYEDLDSLHWFQSVMTKCHAEKTKALNEQREGKTGVGKDEKLVQTLSLKTKRLNNYKREFDLVAFALRSARIFFRTDVENEIIPREKDAASDAISVKSSSNDAAS